MVKVGKHATAGAVERIHRAAIVIHIAVAASQAAATADRASKAVDALVIAAGAGSVSIVIRAAGSISERPKIIVEGVIFLHHDDDVVDLCQAAIGKCHTRREQAKSHRDYKTCTTTYSYHWEPPEI
jgi:hypothetical protein